jgi:eukaryotic-like serine/threonine-protein kinase
MEPLAAQDPPRIGPFRLVAVLGRGGMGRVYLGRAESTGRAVALKTVHGELLADQEFRTRFTREVAAARQVRNDCIAEVVAADPHAAVPWLATAYVPGISVEEAVRRFGPLPADSVRVLGFCVARAVAAIHAVGLVHRDLKPGNVLLTAAGPKVIDFGIARGVAEEGLTRTGMVAGSPPYMAPEQLRSGDFSPASDVFSLAAILHYAATAVGPYGRGGSQEIFARAVMHGPLLDDGLPDSVAPLIRAAMSVAVADRPDAAGLARRLEQYAGEQPGPGWLPTSVLQEILVQAAAALSGESPPGGTMLPTAAAAAFASPTVRAPEPAPAPAPRPPQAQVSAPAPSPVSQGPAMQAPRPQNQSPQNQGSQNQGPQNQGPRIAGQGTQNPGARGRGAPAPSGPAIATGTPPGGYAPPFAPGAGSAARPAQPQPRTPYQQRAMRYTPPQSGQQFRPPPGRERRQARRAAYRQQANPNHAAQGPYNLPAVRPGNNPGTTGLVLSLVSIVVPCLLPVSLIFSLVGLGKSAPGPVRPPRGAATAGMIISVVLILVWIVVLVAIHAHQQATMTTG